MIPFVELCFAEITGSGFHAQASGLTRRGGWLTLHLLTAESFDWNDLSVRIWWNWQTRYFEVVVGQPVKVRVLSSAPISRGSIFEKLTRERLTLLVSAGHTYRSVSVLRDRLF